MKKLLSMTLAFAMMLTLSVPAFAANTEYVVTRSKQSEFVSYKVYTPAVPTEVDGMYIIDEGELNNGVTYKVYQLSDALLETYRATTRSADWTQNVYIPVANAAGDNAAQIGYDFIASPDRYAQVAVLNLPTSTPSVNIGYTFTNGMDGDWVPSVGVGAVVVFDFGSNSNYEASIGVSTFESQGGWGRFHLKTTNSDTPIA